MATVPDRILAKYEVTDTCWVWTGAGDGHGYGHIWYDGRVRKAHRVIYELAVGPIPGGLDMDHICRVRSCVNPDHLEPVTRAENLARGKGSTANFKGRSGIRERWAARAQ